MKKKVSAPTLFGIIIGLLAAMLIAVLLINIANAKEISELLNNGKKTEAEALIEKHPGCLNTRPAYAPRWLARFMDFPQSGYLLPDACSNGYYDTARRMVELGADTFWEVFVPEDERASPYRTPLLNSYCHAWSCAPAYFLRSAKSAH